MASLASTIREEMRVSAIHWDTLVVAVADPIHDQWVATELKRQFPQIRGEEIAAVKCWLIEMLANGKSAAAFGEAYNTLRCCDSQQQIIAKFYNELVDLFNDRNNTSRHSRDELMLKRSRFLTLIDEILNMMNAKRTGTHGDMSQGVRAMIFRCVKTRFKQCKAMGKRVQNMRF